MKAELGIKNGRPHLRIEPENQSEASVLDYMRSFMPFAPLSEYNDGCGTVIVQGDQLPGSWKDGAFCGYQDATAPSVSTEESIARERDPLA